MYLLKVTNTVAPVERVLTSRQSSFLSIGLIILMLGRYSKPPSLSHLMPYILVFFILVSPSTKKSLLLDKRVQQFAIVYLASIVPIIIYSLSNLQSVSTMLSGLDNLIRVFPLFVIGLFLRRTRIIELVLGVSLIVSFLLVLTLFLNPEQIRTFFIAWYSDPTKALQSISMRRGIATMVSPAGLGYFAVLSIVYFVLQGKIFSRNTEESIALSQLLMVVAVLVGLFSVSKTFLFGLLISFALLLFTKLWQNMRNKHFSVIFLQAKKDVPRIVLLLLVIFLLLQLTTYFIPEFGNTFDYFNEVLNDPFTKALSGRYDNVLLGMQDMILEVFPLGYGFFSARYGDVFVGDSGYLLILFMGGIFTFCLYYLSLILLGAKNRYLFIIISLGLFVDLGRPAFWGSRASDLLWILVGFWYYSSKERKYENQTLRA